MNNSTDPTSQETEPGWQPLSAIERRVVGVLVEKAKTTPEQYPLTLNALRNGCNQKSNRHPLMQLDDDRVIDALDHLRQLGAIVEVHDTGRAAKYRHRMYEWLGVEKVELAVMAELLLRGAQTVGELRGRAARMDPIADLAALRPVLDSLKRKGLIIYLTPEGRGCVVTHALYQSEELARLQAEHGRGSPTPASPPAESPREAAEPTIAAEPATGEVAALKSEVATLRNRLEDLASQVSHLSEQLQQASGQLGEELRHIKQELGI